MEFKGVLSGVTVLDLSRVLAGPYCGMLLADMGADVIKVEMPGVGDDSRAFGPFVNGESAYYINFNRNKRGVTLNLKHPKGKEVFLNLVKQADILIENYRPGTMEKLGLGYEVLKEINPRLVYGAVSGFGHTGPYSKRAGYDIIGQAMGGLMSTTGWPGGEPTRTGTPIGDVLGGLSLSIGVLGAYVKAAKTGQGQKVDVALVDSVVSAMTNINMIYLNEGRIPDRIGNRYESTYPYDSFQTKDGSVIIGAGNDKLYSLLCNEMGRPELIQDPRFITVSDRVANHVAVKEIVDAWTGEQTVDQVADRLTAIGVPACPINSIDRIVSDPHIAGDREMFVEIDHPVAGRIKITGDHLKFSSDKITIQRPAPVLGEHSYEIYQELLGMTTEQIDALKADGAM